MSYHVLFTRRAERDLEAIPTRDQARIARRVDSLATDPRPSGVKKLTGSDDLYRLRAGDYRIIYGVRDDVVTVTVIRIGHRRDIYR